MKTNYTARQVLEIKSSGTYIIIFIIIAVIAHIFQILGKVDILEILRLSLISTICVILAYVIYKRKKLLKATGVFEWILGFISVNIPLAAKFAYAQKYDWTFALESYNSSVLMVILLVMLQLYFNRRLMAFYTGYTVVTWTAFLLVAIAHGAVIHWDATLDGKPVHGFIIFREIFFIMITAVFGILASRNIKVVQQYDDRSTRQLSVIQQQSDMQRQLNETIKEKVADLLEQVKQQDILTIKFNEKMQNQASTFEEISATLEELLGSAESIARISEEQVGGNEMMETIVSEFKVIKNETRQNLDKTIQEVENVVARTGNANERIKEVEATINQIREQSQKIGDTINVIVDIADKINLLSLNASIEAARAGEYGRGFAVVADEIGKLAFQTSESIKDIEKVLIQSTKTTETGVEVIRTTAEMLKDLIARMAESSSKIKILQDSVTVEEKYIKNIIAQMEKNVELAKNIGAGTEEQKAAIETSAKAIEHMNEVVAQMVDEIQQLAHTSRSILDNATALLEKSRGDSSLDTI
ncbi:MAG TPA: methyl-accepting chemotaxis protein [Spirochaetota bacterium]|nr:methyl-accepting chemotaxis protein [Spirochaetota bacterium]